jgi:hypothetical protein
MNDFGKAIKKTFGESSPKKEGEQVSFDMADMNVTFSVRPEFQNPDTTYVERRVPVGLEDEAHELLDNWLKSKGFDPEEI